MCSHWQKRKNAFGISISFHSVWNPNAKPNIYNNQKQKITASYTNIHFINLV